MKSRNPLFLLLAVTSVRAQIDGAINPLSITPQDGSTIVQVEAGSLPLGPDAMLQAYAKYHKPAPSAVIHAAAAATQSGTVTASNLPFDSAYLSPVTVGKKVFMLDFDTGSSDLWTFSTLMPTAQQNGHQLYTLGGKKIKNDHWAISYGDGSGASGDVYADKVVVGKVTATVQAVEAATSVSTKLQTAAQDGLLGLGFDGGNTCYPRYCFTFMDQVGPSLPKNLFTATLKKGAPGSYDFGFLDASKYKGSIAYTPVDHSGTGNPAYWEFVSPGYAIGSGAKVARNQIAIADTGTSLAYVDQVVVNQFYASVKGAHFNTTYGGVIFDCTATLPTLSIYIGTAKRTMPGSYALYGRIAEPAGYCFGGVQANTNIGFTILGDVFLKSQYVVFDLSVPRLGFAQQA